MLKFFLLILSISLAVGYPNRSERIVGGSNAGLGQVPWQASLRAWGSTFHFAGGVLINNRWVLTAANVVEGRAANSINMALGIVNLSGTFTSRRSDTITIHPGYNPNTLLNDIACIRSSTAIGFNANIQPISLVSVLIPDGTGAQVSGWGSVEPNKGPNSQILQVLRVITDNCTTVGDPRLQICASGTVASSGICTTDVGGPLNIPGLGLIGIASWHDIPCGSTDDVYVRISWYRNWIGGITGA